MYEEHSNQLRKRFINEGLENFEKNNILELLLCYSIQQKDTNEIAHHLIDRFGSISEVLEAPISELVKIDGIDEYSAAFISMIPQICRKYMEDKSSKSKICGIDEIAKFASNCFIGMTTEHFLLICVDNKCTMLNYHFISEGSVDSAFVDLRKIIQILVGSNATAAVVAHNHPRGSSLPSKEDLKTTSTIASALKLFGIKLLDHVIVSSDDYISMAEYTQQFGYYLDPM